MARFYSDAGRHAPISPPLTPALAKIFISLKLATYMAIYTCRVYIHYHHLQILIRILTIRTKILVYDAPLASGRALPRFLTPSRKYGGFWKSRSRSQRDAVAITSCTLGHNYA